MTNEKRYAVWLSKEDIDKLNDINVVMGKTNRTKLVKHLIEISHKKYL